MIPAIVAATLGWGTVHTVPPPPWLLAGYQRPAVAYQVTIPGPVEMPNQTMFTIRRGP